MQRLQAYKFELRPNGEQARQMARFAGARRFVYNKALALQKDTYAQGGAYVGYVAMAKHLTAWRNGTETPWLKEAPVHPLQQALKDLERAYQNFFDQRADFPRFKKKGVCDRFRYPDKKQIKLDQANNRIFLPKLGWLRYRNSRTVPGEVKNVTVSQRAGKWFVSIQSEWDAENPVHPSGSVVGIDMGVVRFATFSDGEKIDPLNSFHKHQRALTKAQQSLSRKVKRSRNWIKQKRKIARLHARIADVRNDFLHRNSTTISKNHAVVVLEDLAVKNMSASAKGTTEQPGRNVRQKSGLNRSILDQGWGEFRRQLEYKQTWRGGRVIAVPPQNTSRTCPMCGHVSAANRKTQAAFCCVACGFSGHADWVAATNIKRAGLARIACEVSGAERPPAAGTHRTDGTGKPDATE